MKPRKKTHWGILVLMVCSFKPCNGMDEEPQNKIKDKRTLASNLRTEPESASVPQVQSSQRVDRGKERKPKRERATQEKWQMDAEGVSQWMDEQDQLERNLHKLSDDRIWEIEANELTRSAQKQGFRPQNQTIK